MKRIAMMLATTVFAAAAYAQPPGGGPPPAPVRVAAAEQVDLSTTTTVPGTVTARHDARLAAEVAGRLVEVAEVGTRVAAGDVVARIDDAQLRLQQAEFEAGVARERGRLEFLTREAERLEGLLASNLTARSTYENTVNNRDVARADLRIQQARLAQVNDQIARTRLTAPFAGVVAERLAQAGERVAVGGDVVRLTSPDEVEIVARAPLAAVPFLEPGQSLRVTHGESQLAATLRAIVPFGDDRSHLLEVRLDPPPGSDLKAGQAVRVAVPIDGQRSVVAVPRDALVLRRDGAAVFRIGESGTAERLPVIPGASDGVLIEVVGAVQAGDRVVIRGAERLQPGQPVTILD